MIKDTLRFLYPHAPSNVINAMAETFPDAVKKYGLNTNSLAFAFGQVAVESGGLTKFSENLHYSESRMLEIYGVGHNSARITPAEAAKLAGNPEATAKRVYGTGAKAKELGNKSPQDGWDYRGSGPIQITGRVTFSAISKLTSIDFVGNPDAARDPKNFWDIIFGFFMWKHALPYIKTTGIDEGSITHVTKVVNGGTSALHDRILATEKAAHAIAQYRAFDILKESAPPVATDGATSTDSNQTADNSANPVTASTDDSTDTADSDTDTSTADTSVNITDDSPETKPEFILARFGDTSNADVSAAQETLNSLHYWNGTPSGDYDGYTRDALFAFMADNGFDIESSLRVKHVQRLKIAQPRAIPDDRATATASDLGDSFTVRMSKRAQNLAVTLLGFFGVSASSDNGWSGIITSVVGNHDTIKTYVDPILNFFNDPTHLKIIIMMGLVAFFVIAAYVIQDRLMNHRTGATLHR